MEPVTPESRSDNQAAIPPAPDGDFSHAPTASMLPSEHVPVDFWRYRAYKENQRQLCQSDELGFEQQDQPSHAVRSVVDNYAQNPSASTGETICYADLPLSVQGDASLRAQQVATIQGAHAAVEAAPPLPSVLSSILSFIIMFAVVVGAALLLRTFVISPYVIPSGSMEQTILSGDNVFSEKVSYYLHDIEPGDIVTFEDPEVAGRILIKRCIAVGGQTVDLQDGIVYVDGVQLDEPYTQGRPSNPLSPAVGVEVSYPYMVPDGFIWVMGDNRTNSADSRYFGAVPANSVTGHAFCIFWPFDRLGFLS